MNQDQECMLMNVKLSDSCRHFGGMLEIEDYTFWRFFGILTDDLTGAQLESLGVRVRCERIPETQKGEYPIFVRVIVDYDFIHPEVEAILNDGRSITLEEKTKAF